MTDPYDRDLWLWIGEQPPVPPRVRGVPWPFVSARVLRRRRAPVLLALVVLVSVPVAYETARWIAGWWT